MAPEPAPADFWDRLEREFLGQAPLIAQVRSAAARAAEEDRPVLLTGETGTGKDLLAQAIHAGSRRRNKPLQVVAVSGLRETAWSVLFGHRKGAFTGADWDHEGVFRMAHQSTLVLEDVSDLPPTIQPMLLRAVEHGVFRPMGREHEVKSDVRIIATTNISMDLEVAAGRFRPDLYQRLSVLKITLPPLRSHLEDLEVYVPHFLAKAAAAHRPAKRINSEGMKVLAAHSWPRNVRELEHVLYRASVEARGEEIDAFDLERMLEHEGALPIRVPRPQPSRMLSRSAIRRALEESAGNKREAARRLRIAPGTFYALLRKHQISSQ